jgi:ArsR family transcriptional regulator
MEELDMDMSFFEERAELLKILGHPARLCMVYGLIQKGRCNVSTMQVRLGLPQSTISQHLSKLKQAKIVTVERMGLEMFYTVKNPVVIKLMEALFQETISS